MPQKKHKPAWEHKTGKEGKELEKTDSSERVSGVIRDSSFVLSGRLTPVHPEEADRESRVIRDSSFVLSGRLTPVHPEEADRESRVIRDSSFVLSGRLTPAYPEEAETAAQDETVPLDVNKEKKAVALKRLARSFAQRANEIELLLDKAGVDPEKRQDYIGEAASLACKALRKALENPKLREGIQVLALTRQHLEIAEVVSVLADIEGFFKEEKKLLVECGVSDNLATEIVADCRRVFENVRNGQAPRGQVFEAVERITRKTCELKERLEEQANRERKLEQQMKILKTASKAIGGVTVVALNVSIFATPGTQAFSAFSGVLGAGLIEAAAQEL